ncbi:MAG: glycosyltransferase [Deltaproteobacteria bacterium]|jgi:glycosyltransferase involved in cell wall biosynthesis|nr:glycosyltransferase [Deltaproteobacteria bacterium]
MNVLVFSQYYPRNGSQSGIFIHNQNVNLIKLGINVTVVVPTPWSPKILWFKEKWRRFGQLPAKVYLDGVEVFYLRYPFLRPSKPFYQVNAMSLYWWAYRFITKNLLHKNFDLILARPLIPTGYSACLLSKRINLPLVCEGTGSDVKVYPYYNRTSQKMFTMVLKNADKIIANAENLAEDINAHAGCRICDVVYRGVNVEKFKPLNNKMDARKFLGIDENNRVMLFVGGLSKDKGIYDLLTAFKITLSRFTRARLYLIGQNFLGTDINQLIKDENLNGKVYYMGSKFHAELPLWYNACDFLVLPSYTEGMPNVVFEAMACAKPVVVTSVGGIPEVVKHNVTGLLVEPGEVDKLAEAMLRLLTEDGLAESLGEKALIRVRESFVDTDNINRLIELLKNLLAEKGRFLFSKAEVR